MYTVTETLLLAFGTCAVILMTIFGIKQAKLEINSKLVVSCSPYILIPPLIRSLVDAGVYEYSIFLVTPLVFFLPVIILLIIFMVCSKTTKIDPFFISWSSGLIILLHLTLKIKIINIYTPILILMFTIISCGLLHILFTHKKFLSKLEDSGPVYAHVFDSLTTLLGSKIGYHEAHIVPNLIISMTDTHFSFFLVKIVIPILAVFMINKIILDISMNRTFKGAIFLLGCYTGLRNFFRIIMMC